MAGETPPVLHLMMRTDTRSRFGRITEGKMERWFGRESVEEMLRCSHGLLIPTPVMGVPVFAYKGTFIPRVQGGAGFASLSDLISEATTGGKSQNLMYNKTSTIAASAVAASQDLWNVGALPAAGANAAAAPGGTVPDRTSAGAFGQQNAGAGDQLYMTTWTGVSTATGAVLLFDRLFSVLVSEATASNAVTGVQNRYTAAAGSNGYPGGVFISTRVTTVRAANADTCTITYTDQDNNASASTGAQAMRSAAAVGQVCLTPPTWSFPLASGDQGVRQITNVTYNATSTGVIEFFLGYPIAILPSMAAGVAFVLDGINSAFNLIRIQDNACLSFMEFYKTATAAQTYSGQIVLVSG